MLLFCWGGGGVRDRRLAPKKGGSIVTDIGVVGRLHATQEGRPTCSPIFYIPARIDGPSNDVQPLAAVRMGKRGQDGQFGASMPEACHLTPNLSPRLTSVGGDHVGADAPRHFAEFGSILADPRSYSYSFCAPCAITRASCGNTSCKSHLPGANGCRQLNNAIRARQRQHACDAPSKPTDTLNTCHKMNMSHLLS